MAKSRKMVYVPLEPYPERYTMQLSAAKDGWWERNLRLANIPYVRVEGDTGSTNQAIEVGSVLDPIKRTKWAFRQIETLMEMIQAGKITSDDVIYFDDFWHPGIEQLPYLMDQLPNYTWPDMYAFCHAQSADEYDFTFKMKEWIRFFEKGINQILSGVFVSCPALRLRLMTELRFQPYRVHDVGHVWDSGEVRGRLPYVPKEKKRQVVFSSRWDAEKQPGFFLTVAERVIMADPTIKFIICTSAPKLRSNSPWLLDVLKATMEKFPENIILKEDLTKFEYYEILAESKIQFNCSLQDWVSYVLLEATAFGCVPVYPNFRSFPETLWNDRRFLYEATSPSSAVNKILNAMDATAPNVEWVHNRFNSTWLRILRVMRMIDPARSQLSNIPLDILDQSRCNPFNKEEWTQWEVQG